MDWKFFTFDYHLDQKDFLKELIQIEGYKEGALNLVLPPDWASQLDRLNRVRAVHGTTALEGNPLSEAEVSQQLDSMMKQQSRKREDHATKEQVQIRNAGLAQSWVKLRFGPDNPPFEISDLLRMHRTITEQSDELQNNPGHFRTWSVVVGTEALGGVHKGAPAADLDELMKGYIEFINHRRQRDLHPVVRALLSHFFLITIHPFGDGNGRVSRLVEAGILYEGGYNVLGFYGLSNYFYRNEAEYKTALQRSRDRQPFDLTEFVRFGLAGFASELKGINNFIKTKLNRVVYRDMLVRAFNRKTSDRRRVLNQREYSLLLFLLNETEPRDPFSDNPSRRVRYSELLESPYIKEAYKTVTPRTFIRELIRLSGLGFIKFERDGDHAIVELDFGAIGKH